jgi:flagellar basal-body rod protein FlgG
MLRALYSAATGMESQQLNLDVIANNLANVNTTGYKKSNIEFQDLLYDTVKLAGADAGNGAQLPTGLNVGHGTRAVATTTVFSEGELTQTGNQLDVAIQGDGFFQVTMPDGSLAYTRDGSLKTNAQGQITTADGLPVANGFQPIPVGTTSITISNSGQMTTNGANGAQTTQLTLVRFPNESGLQNMGGNLYTETLASGAPETGNPGSSGFGTMQQGYLESSNVSVVTEMVNMITAQRAYEINSKAVQAADEMMQQSDNLKR